MSPQSKVVVMQFSVEVLEMLLGSSMKAGIMQLGV
jgi:hypothetical protein